MLTDFPTHPKPITAHWGVPHPIPLRLANMDEVLRPSHPLQSFAPSATLAPSAVLRTFCSPSHLLQTLAPSCDLRTFLRLAKSKNILHRPYMLTNVNYIFRNEEGAASGRLHRARGGSLLRRGKGAALNNPVSHWFSAHETVVNLTISGFNEKQRS